MFESMYTDAYEKNMEKNERSSENCEKVSYAMGCNERRCSLWSNSK